MRPGELHVVTEPEPSSFESGYAYWRIDRIECNAMILLERDMENDTNHLKSLLTTGEDCSDARG